MTNVIETKNLCRYFVTEETQVKALDNVSFTVEKGEFTAIIGPSGSGKTTLLHLIGGLDNPSSGIIELSGAQYSRIGRTYVEKARKSKWGSLVLKHLKIKAERW
jgi:putative ABC transport system ATP-binding protein